MGPTAVTDDPYDHPDLYDLEYADHDEDVAYYVSLAGRRARDRGARSGHAPVLELGCGTGRLSLPLARAGHPVLGLDASLPMLAKLDQKLRLEPEEVRQRVATLAGDFCQLDLQRRFKLVLWPFNAMHHCPGARALVSTLERIRDHVEPGGLLAFDAYLPDRELYVRDPEERFEQRSFTDPTTGERLDSWEQGWWDEADRIHHVLYVYARADGSERRTHLRFHMWELDELRECFADAGFQLLRESEDFVGTPLGARPLKLVGVARA